MKKIDMSAEAIDRRLRQVAQLRNLCVSLGRAQPKEDAPKECAPTDKKATKK